MDISQPSLAQVHARAVGAGRVSAEHHNVIEVYTLAGFDHYYGGALPATLSRARDSGATHILLVQGAGMKAWTQAYDGDVYFDVGSTRERPVAEGIGITAPGDEDDGPDIVVVSNTEPLGVVDYYNRIEAARTGPGPAP